MGEEAPNMDPNKRRKTKKRKTFLGNAKKYAKKGQRGRGTSMPEETYQYFMGILEAMKQGIQDKEERVALVNNVLERTKGDELNIVCNQLGSRVIEILLPYSSPEDLERFMEILTPELRKLCSDNFSSHVIETVLRVSAERATEHLQEETTDSDAEDEPKQKKVKLESKESKYADDHVKKCHEFTLKISKYAMNNLEDFVWDSYANHILRSVLKSLSGISLLPGEKSKQNPFKETVEVSKGIPPHMTKLDYRPVPQEFKDIVKEFANRLSSWPQFNDLPYQNVTSGLLQVLLYAVRNADKNLTRDLLKKLLNESFAPDDWAANAEDQKEEKVDVDTEGDKKEDDNLPPVFKSESAVRLLEAALFVAKKKMYTQIYAKCFINRLATLATRPMLNFTVQRLIDNCAIKEELEPMFDELCPVFPALRARNSGVLVALAKAGLRVGGRQAQYITALEKALQCSEPQDQKYFSVCCLRLTPLDQVDVLRLEEKYFIHIHGSVILQTLLQYQRPAKAVQGLLELSPEALVQVFSDAKGCHAADALVCSGSVGVKARDKLLWRLKGFYQKLALSQYGSRAFEQIFAAATMEQKVKIMTELSAKSGLMNSTQYGKLIADKLDLKVFEQSQKNWENAWKRKEK